MTLLRVDQVTKAFGGLRALDNVSVEYDGARLMGIIGPNGSGKTTLLNVISGFHTPTEGSVQLRGDDVTGLAPDRLSRRGVRRTFQQVMLFDEMTVRENLLTGLRHIRTGRVPDLIAGDDPEMQLQQLLELCALTVVADAPVKDLPFGLTRKLGIALALTGACELLLVDEPAAGLTDRETQELQDLLREIQRGGIGVIVVDHNVSFVFALSDDILVLHRGRVLTRGSAEEVRSNERVIDVYLGSHHADD